MQKQKTLIALGAAAYGALVSWAVTADYYDRKLEGVAERVDILEHFVGQAIQAGSTYNTQETAQNGSADEWTSQSDPPEENFPTTETMPVDISDPENPRGDETGEVDEAGGTEDVDEIPPGETPEQTRAKLQATIDQYTVPDDTNGQQDVATTFSTMEHAKAPFVISRATFASDPDEGDLYEKETLTYYPQHRILLNEDEEVEDDVATMVGWKNLNRFGDESESADVVFIRNQRLETDYEVVREEDQPLPLHVKYSMGKDEFETAKAAGVLRLREEDLVD